MADGSEIGRPKLRSTYGMQKDMEEKQVKKHKTGERGE